MQTPLVFVGIDVSKVRLDVAVRPSRAPLSVAYDATGITTVLTQLSQWHPTLIVVEATGGLERLLVRALVDAALPVIVVNPRQVRDCAKATGKWAKTDTLDAQVLARFGEVIRPPLRVIPDDQTQELAAPPSAGDAGGRAASPGSRPGSGSETDRGPSALVARRTGAAGCGPG